MWGLGKKKKNSAPSAADTVAIETVPVEFYAGANPVITFRNVEKEVVLGEKISHRSVAPTKPPQSTAKAQKLLLNRKAMLLTILGLFLFFVASAGAFYWYQSRQIAPAKPAVQTTRVDVEPEPEPIVEPEPVAETPSTTEAGATTTPISLADAPLDFPSTLLADSLDSDNDGLSDPEEELFKTDPEIPDSDRDGHPDSSEVYNLYNPKGEEPMKIYDSGLIKEFVNPVFGYKLYYPHTWIESSVDTNYRDVLFSTLSGEFVEVRAMDKKTGQNFQTWFDEWAQSERYSDLLAYSSRFEESGFRRTDYLVYYFEDTDRVYVVLYHTTNSDVVNYRTVAKMIAQSFRLGTNNNVIPLPTNDETTSTTPEPSEGADAGTTTEQVVL